MIVENLTYIIIANYLMARPAYMLSAGRESDGFSSVTAEDDGLSMLFERCATGISDVAFQASVEHFLEQKKISPVYQDGHAFIFEGDFDLVDVMKQSLGVGRFSYMITDGAGAFKFIEAISAQRESGFPVIGLKKYRDPVQRLDS